MPTSDAAFAARKGRALMKSGQTAQQAFDKVAVGDGVLTGERMVASMGYSQTIQF